MPLNPNGKVDKPALPFPDTFQIAEAGKYKPKANGELNGKVLSSTETKMREIWRSIIPRIPSTVGVEENFFDLGGHSILATRLTLEIRRQFQVDVPLGLIFKEPTIEGLSREIDRIGFGGPDAKQNINSAPVKDDYSKDALILKDSLANSYPSAPDLKSMSKVSVFVTGVTGFLGSFILSDLFHRKGPNVHVFAHVRAADKKQGLQRIISACKAYGVWNQDWENKITVVTGDLGKERLGIQSEQWSVLENSVDSIIHNGAMVHWVYPYSKLRAANVESVMECLKLCEKGKPKSLVLISSTSVLDSDFYVQKAAKMVKEGAAGLSEEDDLSGSAKYLTTGYGQSKWTAEYLVREAGKRGLRGAVIRPSYIVGDSKTGSSNLDDYIIRLFKGCIQLGSSPSIKNTMNTVPVDHVARIVTAVMYNLKPTGVAVYQVDGSPRMRFDEILGLLPEYGYKVSETSYQSWVKALEDQVVESQSNALFPLLHFVSDDLPHNSMSPELDDSNTQASLTADSEITSEEWAHKQGITPEIIGLYLAYLVAVRYIEPPQKGAKLQIPTLELSDEVLDQLKAVGGRGQKK